MNATSKVTPIFRNLSELLIIEECKWPSPATLERLAPAPFRARHACHFRTISSEFKRYHQTCQTFSKLLRVLYKITNTLPKICGKRRATSPQFAANAARASSCSGLKRPHRTTKRKTLIPFRFLVRRSCWLSLFLNPTARFWLPRLQLLPLQK